MDMKIEHLNLRNRVGPCRLRPEITRQCMDVLLGDAGAGAPGGDVVDAAAGDQSGGKRKSKVNDLTGQVFGELTVLSRAENSKAGKARWLCRCSCKAETTVVGSSSINGGTRTCGDRRKHLPGLVGKKFGELTIVKELEPHVDRKGKRHRRVLRRCSCANEEEYQLQSLTKKTDPVTTCRKCWPRARDETKPDLVGTRFGELMLVKELEPYVDKKNTRHRRFLCRCSCGHEEEHWLQSLTQKDNPITACRECREKARRAARPDPKGRVFGELTVLEELEPRVTRDGKPRRVVKCFCSRCERETECGPEYLTRKKDPMTCCAACRRKAGVEKIRQWAERARKEKPDLSGQEFGRWKVVSRAPDYVSPSGVRAERWYCVCSCEKSEPRAVWRRYLENGASRSCGCLKDEHLAAFCFKDLTGKMFGQLFVLGRVDDYVRPNGEKRVQYGCACCCCGETTVVRGEELRNGQKACRACGYEAASRAMTVDLTGQRFGRLVAKVLTGWKDESHQAIWYCECDCGEPCFVHSGDLVSGNVGSCGCLRRGLSKLETYVKQYFDSGSVESFDRYDTEAKFEDLRGVSNGKLSYDFGLYSADGNLECLIECQGMQHYKPVDRFGGEDKLEVQRVHDALKREHAANHGVRLVEVPYTLRTYDKAAAYLRDAGIS